MNPFLNPKISLPFLFHYLSDSNRLQRLSPSQLERYRDKAFKHILNYAYSVPLYHKKYKEVGIHPSDIKGITDITKLPFISKQDLQKNYPDNIIPPTYDKSKGFVVCTGGTTGKPVSIYTDFPTMLRSLGPTQAQMRYFHLNPRKTKIAHIGNFNRYRIDHVAKENFLPHLKRVYNVKNILNLDVNTPIQQMMQQLCTFQPDLIISYPAIFQHLAYLKKKGEGENLHPKLLHVGGAILDEYTRTYVEDAFGCRLLNIYLSVEAQASIAFECTHGHWHIHTDFFHVEAIDDNQQPVGFGKRGHIVLTRLWGQGTPIIRYTGMDDWVTLSNEIPSSCGLKSPVFGKSVEGRMRANIILPDGKIFPPGAFCFIAPVLHDLQTFKVKQYQVIQKKIDEIEILLVIDEDLRDVGASVQQITKGIQKIYQQKTGPKVTIIVREVDEIKKDPKSGKPAPIVVSHVHPETAYPSLK